MIILPLAILLAGSVAVYLVGRLTRNKPATGLIALALLVASGLVMYALATSPQLPGVTAEASKETTLVPLIARAPHLFASFELNGLAIFLAVVAMGLAAVVALFSIGYMPQENIGKFYALLLMMTGGMVGIGLAADLFNLFVMFELMSLSSFILVAFERENWEPVEAGVKYLVMSALGSMVALLGIILIYTYSGSLSLAQLAHTDFIGPRRELAMAIAALFMVGFGVKAAMVPMHTWLPDAHSAAPSGISAMLSGIVISAGLITMIKALTAIDGLQLGLVLPLFAVITMLVGNLMAWVQTDLKRMLAYSSIAHMGYILVGVGAAFAMPQVAALEGMRGGLFHILNHAIMKGGAFLCAGAVLTVLGTRDLNQMAGIGRRIPFLGICFGIFVLALVGAPPLNGFVSKVLICKGAILIGPWGFVLMVLLIFNSLLSLFYYIPALNKVVFGSSEATSVSENSSRTFQLPATMVVAIFILAILTLVLGIGPQLGLDLVEPAANFLSEAIQ